MSRELEQVVGKLSDVKSSVYRHRHQVLAADRGKLCSGVTGTSVR